MEEEIPPDLLLEASVELESYRLFGKSNGTQDALEKTKEYMKRIASGEAPRNSKRWAIALENVYRLPQTPQSLQELASRLEQICSSPLQNASELKRASDFFRYIGAN